MKQLQQGAIIQGRYRIEKLLASGGQAHVYKGLHLVLDRPVAIKLLKPGFTPEVMTRMTKRFEQEARLISSLRDPHTITLYDFGKLPDGSLFMVFEYIDGSSLKELIKSQGKLEAYRVAKVLRQTLSSLQEAHSMGVLHRDIKPANIMIFEHAGRTDKVKLLDFGIAKILREENSDTAESLTGVNSVVGTPRYIAPETYESSIVLGPQADIYSLGLVAYEMLTGAPAVKGSTPVDVFRSQLSKQSHVLPADADAPSGLKDTIHKMLQKPLAQRYKTCEQVLWDLRKWDSTTQAQSPYQVGRGGFDPEDISIPDPFEDVAPTQTLSADLIPDFPSLTVEPLEDADDALSTSSRHHVLPSALAEHTPNPDLNSTSDDVEATGSRPRQIQRRGKAATSRSKPQREALRNQMRAKLQTRQVTRGAKHATTSESQPGATNKPGSSLRTEILTDTANIDELILASSAASSSSPTHKRASATEEPNDRTMMVNIEEELSQDALLRSQIQEAVNSGVFGGKQQAPTKEEPNDRTTMVNIEEELSRDASLRAGIERATKQLAEAKGADYLKPEDETIRLTELPPLKGAAVLKRRRKRRKKQPPKDPNKR